MKALAVVDGDTKIDPADWEAEPPAPEIDEEFLALAACLAAEKIVDDRVGKMRRARQQMRRAYEMLMTAVRESNLAIDLYAEAVRDWARIRAGGT